MFKKIAKIIPLIIIGCALLFAAACAEENETTYRALLIGNSYPGTSSELPGIDNDVRGMKAMLEQQIATPYSVTIKENLTAAEIEEAVTDVLGGADSNDVSLFCFVGHGEEITGSLRGVDFTTISPEQLRVVLDTVPGTKIVLLDSCYSGNFISRSADTSAQEITEAELEAVNDAVISAFAAAPSLYSRSANLCAGNYYVITASAGNEQAWHGPVVDGRYAAFFIYGLALGSGYDISLQYPCDFYADTDAQYGDSDGRIDFMEAFRYAEAITRKHVPYQNVQYYCGDASAGTYNEEFVLWAYDVGESSACGADASYVLDENGVLTITGSGPIETAPWRPRNEEITSVVIGEGITSIADGSFSGCVNLSSVSLPEGLITIGSGAFADCTALTTIDLPEGITTIGSGAFVNCTALASIVLPEGLTTIGSSAFTNCTALTSIDLPEGLTTIGNNNFTDCIALTAVSLPKSLADLGSYNFTGCTGLTSVSFSEGLTTIGDNNFAGCTALTAIDLPEGLTNIGSEAFYKCTALAALKLPEGLISIGRFAFSHCYALTEIVVPESLCDVDSEAFYLSFNIVFIGDPGSYMHNWCNENGFWFRCKVHTEVFVPATPVSCTETGRTEGIVCSECGLVIEGREFVAAATGHSIIITEPVRETVPGGEITFVASYACGCTDIGVDFSIPTLNLDIVSMNDLSITVRTRRPGPATVTAKTIGGPVRTTDAYIVVHGSDVLNLPENLTAIKDEAFMGSSIKEVVVPENVKSIGSRAFADCASLFSVTLPDDLEIADDAFTGCYVLALICAENSTGHAFAQANGIPCILK